MRYRMIMLFYFILTPCAFLLRLIQILSASEVNESSKIGFDHYFLWICIFVVFIAVGFFGATTFRCPKKTPTVNMPLAFASGLFAAICGLTSWFADSEIYPNFTTVPVFLTILKITGFLTAILFIAFALTDIFSFKIPNLCFAIPVLFFIFRLICRFIDQNDQKMTMDHFLLLLIDCFFLLFFLEFGKQYNHIDKEHNFRKLLCTGLSSSALGFIYSASYLVIALFKPNYAENINLKNALFILLTAVFILVFILNHYSEKNLNTRHHHHRRKKVLPGEDANQLYIG